MKMKTTMRCHPTPVRMAIINKSTNKCWWGCREQGTLVHCWWECRLVQWLWEAVWRYLKKLKMDLSVDFNSKELLYGNLFSLSELQYHPVVLIMETPTLFLFPWAGWAVKNVHRGEYRQSVTCCMLQISPQDVPSPQTWNVASGPLKVGRVLCIQIVIKIWFMIETNTNAGRGGKRKFTVLSTWSTVFILVLLFIIILFSIWATVNLLLLHPMKDYVGLLWW